MYEIKKMIILIAIIIGYLMTHEVSYAVEYYVDITVGNDSNSGLIGTPFKTIGKAISMMTAGDVVKVASGDYSSEGNLIFNRSGGSSDAKYTLQAQDQNNKPIVKGIQFSNDWYVIDGFYIDNTVSNGTSPYSANIFFKSGSHNIAVKNCVADHSDSQWIRTDRVNSSQDITPNPTPYIQNITVDSCIFKNETHADQAIVIYGDNFTLSNNEFIGPNLRDGSTHTQTDVLWIFGNGHTVRNNTFHGGTFDFSTLSVPSSSDFIQTFDSGDYHNLTNFLFEGNLVYDMTEFRLCQMEQGLYYTATNWIFRNNVYFMNPEGQITSTFGTISDSKNARFYNNTFITANTLLSMRYAANNNSNQNFEFRNNIVYAPYGSNAPSLWTDPDNKWAANTCKPNGDKACYQGVKLSNNLYYPECILASCKNYEVYKVNPGNPAFVNSTWKVSFSSVDLDTSYAPTFTNSKVLGLMKNGIGRNCSFITSSDYLEYDEDGILRKITAVNSVNKGSHTYCAIDFTPALASTVEKAHLITIWSSNAKSLDVHLKANSAAIGQGADLSKEEAPFQFNEDKDGKLRPTKRFWSTGAYEGPEPLIQINPPASVGVQIK